MEEVTRESIRPLLDLQRIDSAVDRLNQRKADLPEQRELNELTERRVGVGAEHVERRSALDAVVREQTKIETEIQQIDDKVKHEQARLYSGEISNPKELSNIQAEMDALRRRKIHLEDQDLELMEQREGLEKEAGDLTTALAELDATIAETTSHRDAASVQIEEELTRLAAEREQVVGALPGEIVELYEELRAKRGGIAVGALENGVCRACSLPLSPMAREEIRSSDDPIVRCENCRRLLVVV